MTAYVERALAERPFDFHDGLTDLTCGVSINRDQRRRDPPIFMKQDVERAACRAGIHGLENNIVTTQKFDQVWTWRRRPRAAAKQQYLDGFRIFANGIEMRFG